MPARSKRHIMALGGSKVVAVPPEWLSALGLRLGDTVDVIYDSIVLIKPRWMSIDWDFLRKEFATLRVMKSREDQS